MNGSDTSLLTTKLYVPPARPALVPRPRLIDRLNEGVTRQLTLVSAPAGFGKTTLLSEWAAGSDRPVAWISLDSGDNAPARFWAYFFAAVQTIHGDFGEAARAALLSPGVPRGTTPPSIEPLLTGLINEITTVLEPFSLILDDFHTITAPQIQDALTFLLDHLPAQMHLVLAGRADPPWPLARRRARLEMTELRANDLRFTSQEAATFLNQVMMLDLSPADVAALEERTEGWIVGLQMAALSMRGRKDASGFIRAFTGTHRFVLDFLVEEVLDVQHNKIHDFLLKTSILERMTPLLCAAVTDREDSEAILAELEQANVFLIPLDDERRWYRYHPLFADLLRSRLERRIGAQGLAFLHRRASEWYEVNGLITEAVSHALASGDIERVASLVEGNALAMMDHGDLSTLAGWLDALPDEVVRARPWLCVAHAWVLVYAGQLEPIEPLLQDAIKGTAADRRVAGHVAAIRAYAAFLRWDEPRNAVTLAREAQERLSEADAAVRGFTAMILGIALYESGDFEAAAQVFAEGVTTSKKAGDHHIAVNILCELAILQGVQGQLHKAAATCREALQLADRYVGRRGQRLPIAGYAHLRLSVVLREWNDLEAALYHARKGLQLSQQWGQAEILILGYGCLGRVLQAVGEAEGALDTIQQAQHIASDLSPWYSAYVTAWEALVRLTIGDVAAAARWAQEYGLRIHHEPSLSYEFMNRALARVLIAQGRSDEALQLLDRLLKVTEAVGAMGRAIEILVLQALARQAQGEHDQALTALERALTLAEPEGYVRTFIDEGEPMGQLLRQAAARGIALTYVSRLLAELERDMRERRRATASALSSLVEPLSERELEVLRLLTAHLSSTEIAGELFISVNTVRTHIKSIYGKLNVHSRKDAVQRAQELGLL